ncbi:reverse transcriptase [Phytophthora megakarya]|uniref:Reverse transcriptase n=1 Tax=Phytophthora megakarya TaxID=4795 RepID=A0A225W8T2_9STRA|nr:reverse transcriptase [Phytophthora megakarya]
MKDEDEILGATAVSIMLRAKMDDAPIDIAARKEPKRRIQTPIPTVYREAKLWVVSFDGSARVKRGGGAFSTIVWSLPGWEVVKARSGYLERLTVNEAEHNGLLLGLDTLEDLDYKRLVICGDSNLRVWNGRAGSLASAALQRQSGIEVQGGSDHQDLVTLNQLDEILIPKTENPVLRIAAVTTRASQAQEEEVWIADMKRYLSGSIADLTQAEARSYGKISGDYEVDEQDLLFYCPPTPRSGDDRDREMHEEQIGLSQIPFGQISQFDELIVGLLEVRHPVFPPLKLQANYFEVVIYGKQVSEGDRARSNGEVQLPSWATRAVSSPIPILGDLGKVGEGPISIEGNLRHGRAGECKISIPARLD